MGSTVFILFHQSMIWTTKSEVSFVTGFLRLVFPSLLPSPNQPFGVTYHSFSDISPISFFAAEEVMTPRQQLRRNELTK
jgi:hypothetical protein